MPPPTDRPARRRGLGCNESPASAAGDEGRSAGGGGEWTAGERKEALRVWTMESRALSDPIRDSEPDT
jgi:hypothetical protein